MPDEGVGARLREDAREEGDAAVTAHAHGVDIAEGDVRRQVRQCVNVGMQILQVLSMSICWATTREPVPHLGIASRIQS